MKQIPCNEIWYTTINRKPITNFNKFAFDSNITSNTYNNKGVLTFANDLKIIGESAFAFCEELETITLPETITKIDERAFSVCENLLEISIPNNVKSIGDCAFALCVNLTKFSGKYASNDGLCLIVNGILNQFAIGQELQEYHIPFEATKIGWSSFSACQLEKVVLHNKIVEIGHSAFCGSENLSDINIPNSVSIIEDVAFQNCHALKTIFIPKSVSNFGIGVFEGCNDISVTYEDESIDPSKCKDLNQLLDEYAVQQEESPEGYVYTGDVNAKIIHIPDGVSLVKSEAFEHCNKVEVIYVPNSVKQIENGTFACLTSLCSFKGEYASNDGKCLIINNTLVGFAYKGVYEYKLPQGIIDIAPSVFDRNQEIRSVEISEGIHSIGYQAFWGCENLTNIILPDGLKVIGDSAFSGCTSLEKIIIPNSVRLIGGSAFNNCVRLEEISLPEHLFAPNSNIFSGCNNLEKINNQSLNKDGNCLIIDDVLVNYNEQTPNSKFVIPNGVTTIANSAFSGNKNITNVVVPQTVTEIGDHVFYNCINLTSVEFESPIPPKFGYLPFYQNAYRFFILVPSGAKVNYRKALDKVDIDVIIIDKTKENVDDFFHEVIYGNLYDKEISTKNFLSIGTECYRNNDIEGEIRVFEKLITIKGYKDQYPYDMLIDIYKKRKDVENELRVVTLAIKQLSNRNILYEYQKRYERLTSRSNKSIYPTKAPIVTVDKKYGDIFEKLILDLPEFNFYYKGRSYDPPTTNKATNQDVWKIQRYFKKLKQDVDLAYARKDFITAARILEQIILENYWMPTPCDKLIKLYAKSGLYDDEIRVLRHGIRYFSQLRQKRLEYVKMLAKKYNEEEFLNARLAAGGKIQYYAGLFELYNPFPIIEKWEERLKKKLNQHITL